MPIEAHPSGTGITPERETTPPPEVLKMSFNLPDDMIASEPSDGTKITTDAGLEIKQESGTATPPAEVKKVETEPKKEAIKEPEAKKETVLEVKEEPKKEEVKESETKKSSLESILKAPKKEGEVVKEPGPKKEEKAIIKPITPVKSDDSTFDYSPYTEDQKIVLKNMSRQSREYVSKLIKDNESLSKTKDSLYFQHENAYVLSPEFQNLRKVGLQTISERDAWKKCLIDIRNNRKTKLPIGYDNAGNIVYSNDETEPSDDLDIQISETLGKCNSSIANIEQQLNSYPTKYKTSVDTDLRAINEVQNQKFAWVADPKLLDYTVELEGQGEKSLKNIINDFKSMIPPYMQSHPMTSVAANIFVAMQIQAAELRAAKSQSYIAETKAKEASRGEPTSDVIPAKEDGEFNKKGIPREFSLNGMPTGY